MRPFERGVNIVKIILGALIVFGLVALLLISMIICSLLQKRKDAKLQKLAKEREKDGV